MADFATFGFKWGSPVPGTPGGTVTWAADPSLSPSFVATIQSALADWAAVANITFKHVSGLGSAQIGFVLSPMDGQFGSIGFGGAAAVKAAVPLLVETVGAVIYDSADVRPDGSFTYQSDDPAHELYTISLHEIGHVLGLAHYTGAPAVMDGTATTYTFNTLQPSDIDGARYLYGARADAPVFRFYDTKTGDHFYTTDPYEQSAIRQSLSNFQYEQTPWSAPAKSGDTTDVFRFFDTKTGTHFLTSDAHERDVVLATLPNYQYEGVAFQAYTDPQHAGAVTLDRFFNTSSGQHHFSGSAAETAGILAGQAGTGWVLEGAGLIVHQPADLLV